MLVLLLAALRLAATGGLSYVAPFVYALFRASGAEAGRARAERFRSVTPTPSRINDNPR